LALRLSSALRAAHGAPHLFALHDLLGACERGMARRFSAEGARRAAMRQVARPGMPRPDGGCESQENCDFGILNR